MGPRGALDTVPSVTSRSSSWVRRLKGSVAKITVHQTMKVRAEKEIQLIGAGYTAIGSGATMV